MAEQGTVTIAGGVANRRAKLQGKASMPMPITIPYEVTVRAGEMSGKHGNGPFGTFPRAGRKTDLRPGQ